MSHAPSAHPSNGFLSWPFFHIFKSSRQAFQWSKLSLATAGLILTFMGGLGLDAVWHLAGGGLSRDTLASSPLVVDPASMNPDGKMGIFHATFLHEKYCLDQLLKAARKLDFTSGMGDMWHRLREVSGSQLRPQAGQGYGAAAMIFAMLWGLAWVGWKFWVFSLLAGIWVLGVWSIFGGAICRISALRFSKDERLGPREAMAYSRRKFGAFVLAPVIPLIGIVLCAFALVLAGWIMKIPVFGSVLGGVFFFLVLLAGGLLAFTSLGLLAGFSLMWPALGAEGLDCGDAISRGVQYVFVQPERAVGYGIAALIYGALAWLVVKLFVLIMLYGAHFFVEKSFPELNDMWARPTFDALYTQPSPSLPEGAVQKHFTGPIIKLWVGLIVFGLYGYLISYYFTGATIIYYLMRYHVDESDLGDVYVESADDPASTGTIAFPYQGPPAAP